MLLKLSYNTKETVDTGRGWFTQVQKTVEVAPVRVIRYACGTGKAANRYRYQADFTAPDDAQFTFDGCVRANIMRKENPHFNPKKLLFVGQVAELLREPN